MRLNPLFHPAALRRNRRAIVMVLSGVLMLAASVIWHVMKPDVVAAQAHRHSRQPPLISVPDYSAAQLEKLRIFEPSSDTQTVETLFTAATMSVDDQRLFNAPPSRLDFQLTGTLSSASPGRSLVIVQQQERQYSLLIGDTLPATDAEIVRVFPGRAIVRHSGRYESLIME